MKEFTDEELNSMRSSIIDNLRSTERKGIDGLIAWMDVNGFFESPASTQHHLCCKGGLAKHSLNVMHTLLNMTRALFVSTDAPDFYSLIIVSLLHDIGKVGDRNKPMYIENVLKSGKKSDSKPYASNPDLLYVPHEVRSVIIAERFITLTEEEEHAILYHNGTYTGIGYEWKGKEQTLDLLLHWSDMFVSHVTEVTEGSASDE